MSRLLNRFRTVSIWAYGDGLEAFGFDSLKRRGYPLDARLGSQKLQISESCGFGEVERKFPELICAWDRR